MMLQRFPGGGKAGILHGLHETTERLKLARLKLPEARRLALTDVGVQLVSWGIQDYRAKARGGTAGGTSWTRTTRAGIQSRVAKRKPWQSLGAQKAALIGKRDPASVAKRKAIVAKRAALVTKEYAQFETGVDTGRLINSLTYGVNALAAIRVPKLSAGSTAPPKAEFLVSSTSVTVGSNLKYSKPFDARRTIFGPGFIDATRRKKLLAIIIRWEQSEFNKGLQGGSVA